MTSKFHDPNDAPSSAEMAACSAVISQQKAHVREMLRKHEELRDVFDSIIEAETPSDLRQALNSCGDVTLVMVQQMFHCILAEVCMDVVENESDND